MLYRRTGQSYEDLIVHKRQGLSLAEVIIGLALLAVMGISLVTLLIAGHREMQDAQARTQAAGLARELMEKIRERSYLYANDTCQFDGRNNDAPVDGFPPAPYPSSGVYRVLVRCVKLDERLKAINVTVFWGSRHLDLNTVLPR